MHKPGVKFINFEDVKSEISEETDRNPGPVGFSSEPISLRIYSPNGNSVEILAFLISHYCSIALI